VLRSFFISMTLAMVGCGRASSPPAPHPWKIGSEGRWLAASLVPSDVTQVLAAQPGRPLIVAALWATWCEPCIAEMPELDAFQRAHPEVLVLGLATDPPSSNAAIQRVLDQVRPTYAQARLEGGEGLFLRGLGFEWDGILPKTLAIGPGDLRLSLPSPVTRATLEAALQRYLPR